MPIELMILKVGHSAYIILKRQLGAPCAAMHIKHIPHMQYWENLTAQYEINMPKTDLCNDRVWE